MSEAKVCLSYSIIAIRNFASSVPKDRNGSFALGEQDSDKMIFFVKDHWVVIKLHSLLLLFEGWLVNDRLHVFSTDSVHQSFSPPLSLPLSENPVEPDNVNVAFYSEQKSREMSYLV